MVGSFKELDHAMLDSGAFSIQKKIKWLPVKNSII
jgi:hypothetical protein